MEVRVYLRREEIATDDLSGWTAAVVDCLRATSSVAVALASGARSVIPCESRAQALAISGALRAGEDDAAPIEGFDLGNSPAEFAGPHVVGRDIALATTNGSRALAGAARTATQIFAFALLNVGAVAERLSAVERLAVICAGTRGRFALDDAFAAGALIARLPQVEPDDAARAALLLYQTGQDDPYAFLTRVTAGHYLHARGFGQDVGFCAQIDRFPVVPVYRDGALRPLV